LTNSDDIFAKCVTLQKIIKGRHSGRCAVNFFHLSTLKEQLNGIGLPAAAAADAAALGGHDQHPISKEPYVAAAVAVKSPLNAVMVLENGRSTK
jgi:hypothetical protein